MSLLKYIIECLEGTVFEPFANGLLFLLLLVAVIRAIDIFCKHRFVTMVTRVTKKSMGELNNSLQYSPEIRRIQHRVSPYIEIIVFLYMALVSLYSAIVLGLIYYCSSKDNVFWYGYIVMGLLILLCFIYMRYNLAQASWSYHQLRNRKYRD